MGRNQANPATRRLTVFSSRWLAVLWHMDHGVHGAVDVCSASSQQDQEGRAAVGANSASASPVSRREVEQLPLPLALTTRPPRQGLKRQGRTKTLAATDKVPGLRIPTVVLDDALLLVYWLLLLTG